MHQLPEFIQVLLDPRAYPEPTERVELVQTQMSFILLTDTYVYKVKKPVNLGYLDYTTLEKRKHFCQQEIVLNRRLCSSAYLGVVSINRDKGSYHISEQDEGIEYAVKMRRLPQEAMMDVLLAENRISLEMINKLAKKLADFHLKAGTSDYIKSFGSLDTIRQNTEENFAQTKKYIGVTISERKYHRIEDYTRHFIGRNESLFRRRMTDGRIKDCHGDMHAAHICFIDGVCIYDCIEFNERFRYSDVASEIAFLAMDIDHYGRADLSRRFVSAYLAESLDEELAELIDFYRCYRAYVRGKVESFKLDDPHITNSDKEKSKQVADSYFDLASSYVMTKSMLFITIGLVGTGKTVLAEALAKRLALEVVSSDVTRKQLASIPLTEHCFEGFNSGIYSPEFSILTYDTMFQKAKVVLGEGGSVILDASFIKAGERERAKKLAEETNSDLFILECVLDEAAVKQRLEHRLGTETASDGRWEIYELQKKKFEPVLEAAPSKHVIINTAVSIEESMRRVLEMVD